MNPEPKRLWLEALRSNEFKQGTRQLRINDEYCCLGVACEVYRRATGLGEWKGDDMIKLFKTTTSIRGNDLPVEVANWLGLDTTDPYPKYHTQSLASMNDGGWDFIKIANVIEIGL